MHYFFEGGLRVFIPWCWARLVVGGVFDTFIVTMYYVFVTVPTRTRLLG